MIGNQFEAYPKVVSGKPKFKDPYSKKEIDYAPSNIMHDKRVVRGNTYASLVVPTTDASNIQKKTTKQPAAKKQDESREARNVATPEPREGRTHKDMQTDARIEEITDKPPQYEMSVQTDFYIDRPPSPLFKPKKTGNDTTTQILEGELFDYDTEVEPLLNALCTKLLEQSMMEVAEEEELKTIKAERSRYLKLREKELTEAQKQELQEMRKLEEIERRKKQIGTEKDSQMITHKRLYARVFAKAYLNSIKSNTILNLEKQGVYRDRVEYQILSKVVPTIFGEVRRINQNESAYGPSIIYIIDEICGDLSKKHKQKLIERKDTLQAKQDKIEEAKKARALLKQQKKEQRAAQKKKEEFAKFKEDIETEFFKNGQIVVESAIPAQLLTPADGYYIKKPIVGSVGGVFIELISILSNIVALKGSSDFLNEKTIMMFIGNFLTKEMKFEYFPIFISNHITSYLKDHGLTLDKINEPEGTAMNDLTNVINAGLLKNEFEELLMANKAELQFNDKVVQLLIFAFMRLITKKPKDPEMRGRTNAAREKLKLLTIPDDYNSEQRKPKAIVRINQAPPSEEVPVPVVEEKKVSKVKAKEPEEPKTTLMNPYGANVSILALHMHGWQVVREALLDIVMGYFQADIDGVDRDEVAKKLGEQASKEMGILIGHMKLPIFEVEQ